MWIPESWFMWQFLSVLLGVATVHGARWAYDATVSMLTDRQRAQVAAQQAVELLAQSTDYMSWLDGRPPCDCCGKASCVPCKIYHHIQRNRHLLPAATEQ